MLHLSIDPLSIDGPGLDMHRPRPLLGLSCVKRGAQSAPTNGGAHLIEPQPLLSRNGKNDASRASLRGPLTSHFCELSPTPRPHWFKHLSTLAKMSSLVLRVRLHHARISVGRRRLLVLCLADSSLALLFCSRFICLTTFVSR